MKDTVEMKKSRGYNLCLDMIQLIGIAKPGKEINEKRGLHQSSVPGKEGKVF